MCVHSHTNTKSLEHPHNLSLSLSVTHSHTQTFGSQSLSLHAGLLSPPLQPQPTPDFLAASQNSFRRTSYFPQSLPPSPVFLPPSLPPSSSSSVQSRSLMLVFFDAVVSRLLIPRPCQTPPASPPPRPLI